MAEATASGLSASQRAGVLLLLAVLALLPFGRATELAIALAAACGLVLVLRSAIDWRGTPVRLALVFFAAYWLPELLSAIDAFNAARAWREVAVDLRYLPFLLFACHVLRDVPAQRMARSGCAWILLLWLTDALLQATTGWSLGGPAEADRLSGIFGADDLKLGGVVALLSPFLLLPAFARSRTLGALASLAVLLVVLLAGSRAAWVALAVVLAVILWRAFGGGRRALLALAASVLLAGGLASAGYAVSDTFRARIDRSAVALQGPSGLDFALSGRLPIWHTALAMFQAHPLNGVGVRGFRDAYSSHAQADDPWIGFDGASGAFHAHQLLLELGAETGVVGLLCWLLAFAAGLRAWMAAPAAARFAAAPVSLALLAMLFPFNTHYAFYSSAWGGLLFFLLALWLPMIGMLSRGTARPAGAA